MNTVTIDTYKTIQKLQERGFTTDQAEGIVDALMESELVTKSDLKLAINELKVWVAMALLAQGALVVTLQNLVGG